MKIHYPPEDIILEPHDWYVANWRNLPPLPRQPLPPFDADACLARLRKVKPHKSGDWGWAAARVPPWMAPEEARFWLAALLGSDEAASPAALADGLGSPRAPDQAGLPDRLRRLRRGLVPELVAVLAALLEADVLVEALASVHDHEDALLPGFRRYVRPYLDAAERDAMRAALARVIGALPRRSQRISIPAAGLAASVGMPELIDEILSDPRNVTTYHARQYRFLALGLADRKRVGVKVRSDDHVQATPEFIRGVIAHLEDEAVGCFEKDLRWGDRARTERLVGELTRIRRASLAPTLMRLQAGRRSAAAQRWLDAHPELALEGLRPHLGDSTLREAVLDYLRGLIRTDKLGLVERYLGTLEGAVAGPLRQGLDTAVAGAGVAGWGRPAWFPPPDEVKLPGWLDVARLPPILAEGRPLPASCIPAVLAALRESTLDEPRALVGLVKRHADARSLDAFALALFERWLAACGKFEERWALGALGLLGGDGACLRLEKAIRGWLTQRAEYGVQCLRAINSEQALASLCAVADGSRAAANALWALRQERGLSPEELEDFAVPRLGLDGERAVDTGSQVFRLGLTPDFAPCLLDARHHRQPGPPPLREGDDPVRVDLARAEWEVFSQRVGEIVPKQRLRLEVGMRYERRWRAGFFLRVLAGHPLLGPLVRPLVWGAFEGVALRAAFRAGPGGCVDVAGAPVALPEDAEVGIVHPTHLSREERLIWGDAIAEEGLEPPFVQLAREVFAVEPGERGKNKCERFSGRVVAGKRLAVQLKALGWQAQKYWSPRVWKWFPVSRQFACVEFIASGYSEMLSLDNGYSAERVTIGACYATRPAEGGDAFLFADKHRLRLEDVSPPVFDEMLRVAHEAPTADGA